MHTLRFGDYEYIFEYDTEEEFEKRRRDVLKTHREVIQIEAEIEREKREFNRAKEVLDKFANKRDYCKLTWYELEAKFIQSEKQLKTIEATMYKAYASTFKSLQECFERTSVDEIVDYNDFVDFLKNHGADEETVSEHLSYVNLFLKYAVNHKLITNQSRQGLSSLKKEKNKKIENIEEYMAKIHSKKILTVQELEDKYSIAKTTQQQYRGRMHDPLPYHQTVQNGKITYSVQEVERWLENQHK